MLKWDDKLNLGVASIDAEHRYLLLLANEIVKAARMGGGGKDLVPLVSKLREYTVTHFHNEEEYMAGIHYPGLAEHQKAHQELKRRVREYQDDLYHKREISPGNVVAFMKAWLLDHILHVDLDIARFLKKQAEAAKVGEELDAAAGEEPKD